MAKRTRFNHSRKIEGTQAAKIQALMPGMIVSFRYIGKKINDEKE